MLVLSRKMGERIIVGLDIEIVVVEITKTRARIGLSAPPEVLIRRGELERRHKTDGNIGIPMAIGNPEPQQSHRDLISLTERNTETRSL